MDHLQFGLIGHFLVLKLRVQLREAVLLVLCEVVLDVSILDLLQFLAKNLRVQLVWLDDLRSWRLRLKVLHLVQSLAHQHLRVHHLRALLGFKVSLVTLLVHFLPHDELIGLFDWLVVVLVWLSLMDLILLIVLLLLGYLSLWWLLVSLTSYDLVLLQDREVTGRHAHILFGDVLFKALDLLNRVPYELSVSVVLVIVVFLLLVLQLASVFRVQCKVELGHLL